MIELAASVDVEVPFHDVDAMNVAWHGHYVKYFEIARCALLRRFDYDYPQMQASGYLWPIVDCHLKYIRPALRPATARNRRLCSNTRTASRSATRSATAKPASG